mgnify:CR=1 FL=1
MIERTISVDGGDGPLELAVLEAGAGGRPLLLTHGFTGAKEDFADFVVPFAELGWHVLAPDQRGHGSSAKPSDTAAYSFERLAGDLLALLDAQGWERCVALGHSMGGMVVQVAALAAPDRFDGLILMDTSHKPLYGADEPLIAAAAALALEQGMEAVLAAQAGIPTLDNPVHRRLVEARPGYGEFGDRKLLATSPHLYASMLTAIAGFAEQAEPDRLAALASVAVPTLVVVGEEDRPFRKASQRMAEAIPGARLAVIPGGAHSPQFEAPDEWWAAVSGFLATL